MSDEAGGPRDEGEAGVQRRSELLALLRTQCGARLAGLAGGRRNLAVLAALILIGWAATGVYSVQPAEQGVVLRLGKWIDTTGPGLHMHLPYPIETVLFPKITQINQLSLTRSAPEASGGRNQMLTGDENLVEADCVVSWKIKSAREYLFKVYDPETMLRLTAESAVREVIARNPIQSALSDRRQQIAEEIAEALQRLLDSYQAGILITQVQLQRVDPPLAVIDAFNDVQRARADQERARNEAEAYRNDILPRARGEAGRITQEAEAAKTQAIDLAQGEVSSLLAFYQAYKKSPELTGRRLYLDSVDELLKKSPRVIVDAGPKGSPGLTPILSIPSLPEAKPGPPPGAVVQGSQR
jgi:membrane protease subunit HflK